MSTFQYCIDHLDRMQASICPKTRRFHLFRIRERLVDEPFSYTGALRRLIQTEVAKGNIADERIQ